MLSLSRNFGKETAITAGLDHAAGDAVVVIDADLQDPPELIPELIAHWRLGYDMVNARRRSRAGETWLKRRTAHAFYRLMQRTGSLKLPEDTGDFRLLSRRAVDAVRQLREQHRFMKGVFAWIGYPTTFVLYDRACRSAGVSKWTYWRLWNLALEGITSFTVMPLKCATYVGLAVAALSVVYAAAGDREDADHRQPGRRLPEPDDGRAVPRRRAAHVPGGHRRISRAGVQRDEAAAVVPRGTLRAERREGGAVRQWFRLAIGAWLSVHTVMAGEGPPSTPYGAEVAKGVDGGPSPAMTVVRPASPYSPRADAAPSATTTESARVTATSHLTRGINLTNWFRFPPSRDPAALRAYLSDQALADLRAAGFDFVRLAVDPAIVATAAERAMLIGAIRRIQRQGFAVVVSPHPQGWRLEADPAAADRVLAHPGAGAAGAGPGPDRCRKSSTNRSSPAIPAGGKPCSTPFCRTSAGRCPPRPWC